MPTLSECKKYYLCLNESCNKIIEKSFLSSAAEQFCDCHNFCSDLEKWITLHESRPEVEVLKAALHEYQFSLLALVQGQYRQAYMALRLSFELALASIIFSANEFEFRMWLKGERDINWQALINADTGVFSKNFIRAFNAEMADESSQYRTIAEKVYRECSEYVHGNAFTHTSLPYEIDFIDEVFSDWQAKAKNIRLCVTFAFSSRYLLFYPREARGEIESVVMETLSHLDSIRALFSK